MTKRMNKPTTDQIVETISAIGEEACQLKDKMEAIKETLDNTSDKTNHAYGMLSAQLGAMSAYYNILVMRGNEMQDLLNGGKFGCPKNVN